MNRSINQIKIEPTIKVQPITILDAVEQPNDKMQKDSFWSKLAWLFTPSREFDFEEWQRLESKPRIRSSVYSNDLYGGSLK